MKTLRELRLYRALSHPPVFTLWAGEAFSAIGDEIYKVALVWMAVHMVGADAGYLAAGQAGAVLLFSLVGGTWADGWDPRRTMLGADIARGILILIPVAWAYFFPMNLAVLAVVALAVASLSAFFEPAMQAVVPRLAKGRDLLQATNGLMGTTSRLARTVGPAIVGALTGLIPTIHFFTLDALTFAASAYAILRLKKNLPALAHAPRRRTTPWASAKAGFELIRTDALMKYVLYGKSITSGCWNVVLPLGVALVVQKILPGDVRAYGLLLAAYGVGNFGGALVLSNMEMERPMRVMGWGFSLLGLGFFAMTLSPSMPVMMVGLAIAAIGGPMNDLAHIDVIQRRFEPHDLARVVRFRMAVEFSGILFALLLSPTLFRLLQPEHVVRLAGLCTFAVGVVGLYYFAEKKPLTALEAPRLAKASSGH